MQQALDYAKALDLPFVYSSNGDGFIEHDRTVELGKVETEINLENFPSPEELWKRYKRYKNIEEPEVEKVYTQPYHTDGSDKAPYYYQRIAINRTIEAIAKGQDRLLLVMATGTGKTYTAFQIIWRLWKARKKKRILFLADRNILVDQTKNNDFAPFGDKMTKIQHRKVDKSYEIYLALYQGLTGNDEFKNIYNEFSPDFFDLIVIDECHRGSAKEASAWRDILEYFSSATQIGLTATPKETKDISNIGYFGDSVYTYSLKQGIEDGFLAPYKVVRPLINVDLDGWTPKDGQLDKDGNIIEQREYNVKDFDRNLVIDERTELVAKRVSQFLKENNRFDKTIVFCADIDHAERMRQAIANENADLVKQNHKYVMRITGDNEEGKRELDNFIDPEQTYPVIATTSMLMSTGVDAKTCKLIVLDKMINSMTEFKQIIGRGTRLRPDYGKNYFTIMDFRGVTRLFEDPEFDGDPVQIYEPKEDESPKPPEPTDEELKAKIKEIEEQGEEEIVEKPDITFGDDEEESKRIKYRVNGIEVVQVGERVMYRGKDGKLITESLIDYTKKNIREEFATLDSFIKKWNEADKKEVIIQEFAEQGFFLEELQAEVKKKLNKDLCIFDLICHVAFDMPPLTKQERANNVKKRNYFGKYSDKAKAILEALVDKFADEDIESIEDPKVLKIQPFEQFGTPMEILKEFGGKLGYELAIKELKQYLFEVG